MDRKQQTLAALQRFYKDPELPKQLLYHAIWESRRRFFRLGSRWSSDDDCRHGELAKGHSPEDVVQEAMRLTITDDRHWDPEKHPNILDFLKLVVTSLIRNLASSKDHKLLTPMPEYNDGNTDEDRLATVAPRIEEPPEATLLNMVEGPEAVAMENRVFEAISDDPQLLTVYEHTVDGKKPRQIREAMGLSPSEVYRLTQKLRRRLETAISSKV